MQYLAKIRSEARDFEAFASTVQEAANHERG